MNRLIRWTKKPEYLFNPKQVVQRLRSQRYKDQDQITLNLLWGHPNFICNPKETIGKSLAHFGLYDLTLSETLYRLMDQQALCLDIGANIGYFSSLMSRFGGSVHAFEPHPQILKTLRTNCKDLSNVTIHPMALSDKAGEATLYVPTDFHKNEGTSSLSPEGLPQQDRVQHTISTQTLDSLFPTETIDLIKIDVEKHELAVFQGAGQALSQGRIGSILFEDFEGSHSSVVQLLRSHGYDIYRMSKGYWGPQFMDVEAGDSLPLWEPPNYLATRKKDMEFLKKSGWSLFKSGQRP